MQSIEIKRVYEPASPADGIRILVDRLWPRGVSRQSAQITYWAKDVAPSTELRQWYGHDPTRWDDFRRRYFAELEKNPTAVAELLAHMVGNTVTLLFGSREALLNNAQALQQYLTKTTDGDCV